MASLTKLQVMKFENAVRSLKAVASSMVENKESPTHKQCEDWRTLTQSATNYIESIGEELQQAHMRMIRAERDPLNTKLLDFEELDGVE